MTELTKEDLEMLQSEYAKYKFLESYDPNYNPDDYDDANYTKATKIRSIRFSQELLDRIDYAIMHIATNKREARFSRFVIEAVRHYCDLLELHY